MFNYRSFFIAAISMSSMGVACANMDGMDSMPIKITMQNGNEKIIQLVKVSLNKNNRRALTQNMQMQMSQPQKITSSSERGVGQFEVGMNDVPVLDQGVWGTCATFAATAAVDAYLKLKGEESVSQLCNLELGRTLKNPDAKGGWDGSFGDLVLKQISDYGFLSKVYQHTEGCGGLNHYPVHDNADNGKAMEKAIFTHSSDTRFTYHNWKPLLSDNYSFKPISTVVGSRVLDEVKKALLAKHRVVFGTLLAPFTGQAGALGTFDGAKYDTWVLTPEITKNINKGIIAGHEMVIEGFDDAACATYLDKDKVEQQQCGLLHLRNSWSELAGDHGTYYVTYDYFKTMTIEAYEVGDALR